MPSKVHETSAGPIGSFPGSFKYTPLKHVRMVFVRFVQGLFSAAPPGAYRWLPNLADSEIYITDENPIDAEVVGKRPAISFTRGPVKFFSLGMDDMMSYRFDIAQKQKSVLVPGTMAINCCSRNDIESEQIAWVTAEHIWLLRDLLIGDDLFFEVGRQPQIGAPSKAGSVVVNDSGEEWYVTTVSMPFQFYRTSQFTPLGNHIARHVNFSLRSQHTPLGPQQTGPPQGGHELPLNVRRCFPPSYAPEASDVHGTPDPAGAKSGRAPKQPHPLNPAASVVVRTVTPNRPGLRPPSFQGRPLPIVDRCVKESDVQQLSVSGEAQV